MISLLKHVTRRMSPGLCALVLVVLLAACGGSGSTATTTPTPQPPTPTPTPAVVMTTYTGTDFNISYPKDWKASPAGTTVAIGDSLNIYNMTITSTPDPGGAVTADQLADTGVTGAKANLKNAQTVTIAPTTTVAGQTWSQRAVSGTTTVNGQSVEVELIILTTTHPAAAATTKGYIIAYGTIKQQLDLATGMYFMPMLQSFKFAA